MQPMLTTAIVMLATVTSSLAKVPLKRVKGTPTIRYRAILVAERKVPLTQIRPMISKQMAKKLWWTKRKSVNASKESHVLYSDLLN